MLDKDKDKIRKIISKLEGVKLLDVVGSTLHVEGISQEKFDTAMKESENGLMNVFGCNTSNAIRNHEREVGKQIPTLDEVSGLLKEFIDIINKTK